MSLSGKWHRVVFGVSIAALFLSAYFAFAPGRSGGLEGCELRVAVPPEPDVPDSASALPDRDLAKYWDGRRRMVWVQPVAVKGAMKVELPLPRPTLAVPSMPMPDPSPLLERSGDLPRWGELPRAPLEEEE